MPQNFRVCLTILWITGAIGLKKQLLTIENKLWRLCWRLETTQENFKRFTYC